MSDIKFSALSNMSALSGTETFVGLQGAGAAKLGTAAQMKTFANVPGGSNTQVQFNDSSVFGGNAGLTYDKTRGTLIVGDNVNLLLPTGYYSRLKVGANDADLRVPLVVFNNATLNDQGTVNYWTYRGTIGSPAPVQAGDHIRGDINYAYTGTGGISGWDISGYYRQTVIGIVDGKATSYFTFAYWSDLTAKAQGIFLWAPRDEPGIWWYGNTDGGNTDYSAIVTTAKGQFAQRYDEAATTAAGTSFAAGSLNVNDLTASQFVRTDASKNLVSTAPPTITGSRGGNAALADLLTKLAALGLIVDGTS